ncbi:glycoside hydrolase superfamily [Chytriomyces sp. MP71]|nr:glycoside hydrolase superfamily [Chytriomyces sp. MP71]
MAAALNASVMLGVLLQEMPWCQQNQILSIFGIDQSSLKAVTTLTAALASACTSVTAIQAGAIMNGLHAKCNAATYALAQEFMDACAPLAFAAGTVTPASAEAARSSKSNLSTTRRTTRRRKTGKKTTRKVSVHSSKASMHSRSTSSGSRHTTETSLSTKTRRRSARMTTTKSRKAKASHTTTTSRKIKTTHRHTTTTTKSVTSVSSTATQLSSPNSTFRRLTSATTKSPMTVPPSKTSTSTTTTTTDNLLTPSWTLGNGVNSWFLHTQPLATRAKILSALQKANFTTIRIFIREIAQAGFVDYVSGLDNSPIPDVENKDGSGYNDAVLLLVDELMAQVPRYGLKLVLSLHDRWYLGSWEGGDVYAAQYGVVDGSDTQTRFYTEPGGVAGSRLDARLRHILGHRNALMGNRTWGEIGDAVWAIEAENEAMGSVAGVSEDAAGVWQCGRAEVIRGMVPKESGVLVATGGAQRIAQSVYEEFFKCPFLDVISIHDYERPTDNSLFDAAIALGKQYGKQLIVEEFSCDAKQEGSREARANCNRKSIQRYTSLGLPWMYWSVVGLSNDYREVFTDDPTWAYFVSDNA